MAQFNDHVEQAKKNLAFLQKVNNTIENHYDWQVTVCFYTALHLINAHLAKHNMQFRKHKDVKDALNPEKQISASKIPENEYVAYNALQSLSRRARYLIEEGDQQLNSSTAFFTYDKHFAKAIRHLDKIIIFICKKYNIQIEKVSLKCEVLKDSDLTYLKKK